MTEDEAIAAFEGMTAETMRRLQSMPREKVELIFKRLFSEVLTGEEWECPGCGWPWPCDDGTSSG